MMKSKLAAPSVLMITAKNAGKQMLNSANVVNVTKLFAHSVTCLRQVASMPSANHVME